MDTELKGIILEGHNFLRTEAQKAVTDDVRAKYGLLRAGLDRLEREILHLEMQRKQHIDTIQNLLNQIQEKEG
jgi:hypothetical protein